MKNAPIRMGKSTAECFVAKMTYNGSKIDVLLVPQYNGKPGWVGPGFWQPQLSNPRLCEPPPYKYNTKVYTREELVAAGAKPKLEQLWMR